MNRIGALAELGGEHQVEQGRVGDREAEVAVAAAQPALLTRIQSIGRRRKGIRASAIWGGTLKDNEVGPAVYADFLGPALAAGTYRAAPEAVVVGEGLDKIPEALARLRKGVSAQKLVVRL
ncbi:hypothetical protein GCM10010435_50440 [Winogradskya consettensis]|uniref:Uncharacterized protein n=1 Tax=Winogradskya consettensis TaxID=113560 RepID=A0A919VZ88_9ACTN|nr:hypothetical protein [Actinoplanes consettensis]GIM80170.1 hypothetical protein Aco04nite_69340 [Actinoplanes consettensis]